MPLPSGWLALAAFSIWSVAFFVPPALAWLLTVANLVGGVGLAWIGWTIWTRSAHEKLEGAARVTAERTGHI